MEQEITVHATSCATVANILQLLINEQDSLITDDNRSDIEEIIEALGHADRIIINTDTSDEDE